MKCIYYQEFKLHVIHTSLESLYGIRIITKRPLKGVEKLSAKRNLEGTLLHSDHRILYINKEYTNLLKEKGIIYKTAR